MSKIYRYIWILVGTGGHTYSTLHFFVYYSKQRKKYKRYCKTYTEIKFYIILIFFFFLGWIIKHLQKGTPEAPLLFLYEVSTVVLIDFIAILLTLGIFLIQMVNTNNTNMYLIQFHSKNIINMHIPKSYVLKFQNCYQCSIFISEEEKRLFYSELYALHWYRAQFKKKM